MKKGTISKVIILIIGLYQVIGGLYGLLGLIYGIVLKKSEFTFVALVISFITWPLVLNMLGFLYSLVIIQKLLNLLL